MKRERDRSTGPDGASQAVAEPFPAPRPYVGQGGSPRHDSPVPPQPRFTPRTRTEPPPHPQPQFVPHPPRPAPPPAAAREAAARRHPARQPARAIIGDELRIPILWCEFGSCVERYTHADALGERDLRGRALAAGWCYDLLGRLACPSCAQHDPTFWVARPPVPARRRY